MNFIACDGQWEVVDHRPSCVGTLITVARDDLIPQGATAEDYAQVKGFALELFVIIFGILALRKVL